MHYIINYDIAAIVLTLGLLLVFRVRRNYPTRETKLFSALAVSNAVTCAFDIASALGANNAAVVPLWLNYLTNVIFHLGMATSALIFLVYILCFTGRIAKSMFWHVTAFGIYGVVLVLTLTSPATHLLFRFAADGTYVHGPLFFLFYVLDFAIMFLAIISLLSCWKKMRAYQLVPLLVGCLVIVGAVAVEIFFPYLLLQGFAIAVVLILLYEVSETNNKFMFAGSYCYNYRAFRDQVGKRIKKGEPFCIVSFGFNDIAYLKNLVDFNVYQALYINAADILRRSLGQRNVFYLRTGYFAVICKIEKENDTIIDVMRLLKKIELPAGRVAELEPRFAVLRHPGVVNTGREAEEAIVSALDVCVDGASNLVSVVDGSNLTVKRREGEVAIALREAISKRRFEMYYQPIRNVQKGIFDSAEALVRLNDPALGFISPDEFITLAESNGMILEISDQIMEQVCRFWRDNKLDEMGVARMDINLSAVQCTKKDTADKILYTLKSYGIDPTSVCMEVTETAVLDEKEVTKANLMKLHDAGIQLALDDYGTGYSSITNLYEYPFDIIKIDKSLLWGAMEDTNALAVLENVVGMCHSLDKRIVTEGVETEEMVRVLELLGVEHLQGYIYSKPLNEDDYLAFLCDHCGCRGDHWCQARFRKLSADLSLEALKARE